MIGGSKEKFSEKKVEKFSFVGRHFLYTGSYELNFSASFNDQAWESAFNKSSLNRDEKDNMFREKSFRSQFSSSDNQQYSL